MPSHFVHGELDVQTIGHALMSSGKYGYVLPFEVISIPVSYTHLDVYKRQIVTWSLRSLKRL